MNQNGTFRLLIALGSVYLVFYKHNDRYLPVLLWVCLALFSMSLHMLRRRIDCTCGGQVVEMIDSDWMVLGFVGPFA